MEKRHSTAKWANFPETFPVSSSSGSSDLTKGSVSSAFLESNFFSDISLPFIWGQIFSVSVWSKWSSWFAEASQVQTQTKEFQFLGHIREKLFLLWSLLSTWGGHSPLQSYYTQREWEHSPLRDSRAKVRGQQDCATMMASSWVRFASHSGLVSGEALFIILLFSPLCLSSPFPFLYLLPSYLPSFLYFF